MLRCPRQDRRSPRGSQPWRSHIFGRSRVPVRLPLQADSALAPVQSISAADERAKRPSKTFVLAASDPRAAVPLAWQIQPSAYRRHSGAADPFA